MAMINNPNQPDYTGASAQQYIDSYTNRPEDAGSLEGLQNLLGGVGMVPGIGEPADLLNALIYGVQGEGGQAGLSLLSILPFIGGSIKPLSKGAAATAKAGTRGAGRLPFTQDTSIQAIENVEDVYQGAKGEGGFFKTLLKNLFDDPSKIDF